MLGLPVITMAVDIPKLSCGYTRNRQVVLPVSNKVMTVYALSTAY